MFCNRRKFFINMKISRGWRINYISFRVENFLNVARSRTYRSNDAS